MRGNVVDGGAHRRLCGVCDLAEELDVAAIARNERTGGDEDMVRVMSAVKEVQWDPARHGHACTSRWRGCYLNESVSISEFANDAGM